MDGKVADLQTEMAQLGRQFNPEFVEALSDELHNCVHQWLLTNGVPEVIVRANDLAVDLALHAYWAKSGQLKDITAKELPASIAEATNLAWDLGGQFSGGGLIYQGECKVDWPWRVYTVPPSIAPSEGGD